MKIRLDNTECREDLKKSGDFLYILLVACKWFPISCFLRKLGVERSYDSAILLLGVDSEEAQSPRWRDTSIPALSVAGFTVANICNQPMHLSAEKWIKISCKIISGILFICKRANSYHCNTVVGTGNTNIIKRVRHRMAGVLWSNVYPEPKNHPLGFDDKMVVLRVWRGWKGWARLEIVTKVQLCKSK